MRNSVSREGWVAVGRVGMIEDLIRAANAASNLNALNWLREIRATEIKKASGIYQKYYEVTGGEQGRESVSPCTHAGEAGTRQ